MVSNNVATAIVVVRSSRMSLVAYDRYRPTTPALTALAGILPTGSSLRPVFGGVRRVDRVGD
ncbi:hypothetical protein G443_004440 [Actinoalloteichus cyanogriseus DSM 43889]|uniref:Uncharacterized protein n=1 Tax=Actinoalloteichus caeruleus DSM 43889 TaxID=1120930 RepID=A0ABT1JNR9_ACTCY|nr:hypothetical protein [Actinoalloteichus caeruleus DSM 43889]